MGGRVMEKNKSTNIARDFGSYSRRVKGCILYVFGLWRNTEYGPKDKQDCGFIFFHDPNMMSRMFPPMAIVSTFSILFIISKYIPFFNRLYFHATKLPGKHHLFIRA
jgi:hypothetical protein